MDKGKLAKILIVGFFIIAVLAIFAPNTVAEEIGKDSNFKYSTSITSRYSSSDRASVYTTNMSVPDTARYIIDDKRPEDYTDLSNEESIQLTYDDHYVLIYKGEDSKTYVQVSSRKFIHRNGYYSLYRPYNRNVIVFYDRSYRSRGYYNNDGQRYGGGYYKNSSSKITTNKNTSSKITTNKDSSSKITTNKNSSSKITTNKNSSSKITTNKNSTSKIKTNNSSSNSSTIRSNSVGTRKSTGGGISFGK